MREVVQRYFDLPGLRLAANFWPGQGTPILALHGFLDNANSFVPLAEHLPNPLLALDFAGHGLSAHRADNAQQSFLDHVSDVCRVAQQLQWDQFILLGHSMGGAVASLVAASRLLPLSELWVLDAIGPMAAKAETAGGNFAAALAKQLQPRRAKPVYASLEAAANARTQGFGGLTQQAAEILCARSLEACAGGLTWRTDARLRLPTLVYLEEAQVSSMLRRIKTPTLLIKAMQGLGGQGVYHERIKLVRDMSVVELPGRHHVHMEDPQSVAAALLAWHDQLMAQQASAVEP